MTDQLKVPSAEVYPRALKSLAYWMPHKHRQMLLKHYRAPQHTMTATELAGAVGYPDWNTVNLQYGTLATKLADRMKWLVRPDLSASHAIASFVKPGDDTAHWQWVMRPELVAAHEGLGWVTPASQ